MLFKHDTTDAPPLHTLPPYTQCIVAVEKRYMPFYVQNSSSLLPDRNMVTMEGHGPVA